MDNIKQNILNKNTQNEEIIGDIVECGLDLATDGLECAATNNITEEVVDSSMDISNDLAVDDIDDGGILESLLDNLDDIPIIGIVIGGIAIIGGIVFVARKFKKK